MNLNRTLLFLALTASLSGCLFPLSVTPTRHYIIDPKLHIEPAETLDLTLGFRPLAVAQPYDRRMAFVAPNHLLGYRPHEEWAEKPEDTATRAIADALIATKRFKDLGDASHMARPDLMLTGEIRKFHEDRTGARPMAVVEMRLELREARGNAERWADTLHAEIPIEGGLKAKGNAVAAAMTQALAEVAEKAAAGISRAK